MECEALERLQVQKAHVRDGLLGAVLVVGALLGLEVEHRRDFGVSGSRGIMLEAEACTLMSSSFDRFDSIEAFKSIF